MRINELNPGKAEVVKAKKIEKKSPQSDVQGKPENTAVSGNDSVKVSSTAKQIHTLRALYEDAPDLKAQRVSEVKVAIESGQYQPDYNEVASALVNFVQGK